MHGADLSVLEVGPQDREDQDCGETSTRTRIGSPCCSKTSTAHAAPVRVKRNLSREPPTRSRSMTTSPNQVGSVGFMIRSSLFGASGKMPKAARSKRKGAADAQAWGEQATG